LFSAVAEPAVIRQVDEKIEIILRRLARDRRKRVLENRSARRFGLVGPVGP